MPFLDANALNRPYRKFPFAYGLKVPLFYSRLIHLESRTNIIKGKTYRIAIYSGYPAKRPDDEAILRKTGMFPIRCRQSREWPAGELSPDQSYSRQALLILEAGVSETFPADGSKPGGPALRSNHILRNA